ncbi:peptidylprolyl isomerase [Cytophagaceae bacterium ABcell3]|nr:peptidylprolyl isomerase [Cytophagaceae bacterium ABcell3]
MRFTFGIKLLLLALWIVPIAVNGQNIDKIVAKVDNHIVLKSELEVNYVQYLQQEESYVPEGEDLKCRILENLVVNKLLLAKAEIDSVVVERDAVEDQLDRRMQYFIQQFGGSPQKLEEFYKKSIDDLKGDLRKSVKEQMIIQRMQEKISGNLKVTPAEVKRFFNEIPADSLPYISAEVEVGHIVKLPPVGREQKRQARATLERLRTKIANGADFCDYAKQYSEDPGSAKKCGELGFFKRGELVPEYEAAALKLKPGELSGIVESQFGFHLIQMIERRGNEFNTRHILVKPAGSTVDMAYAENFLDSLRNQILADSISFQQAAHKHSDDKMTNSTGGLFSDPDEGGTKISLEDLDPGMYFVIDTMQVGSISKPMRFRMEDGTEAMRIVYYKSKTPPHRANLRDDYQRIQRAALSEKKSKALDEWFERTRGEVFIDIDDEYNKCKILQ